MPTLDQTKLTRLHWLIARGWAGPPATLAAHLGVAPRTLHRYLRALRDLGAPVAYCRLTHRYGYATAWQWPFSAPTHR
ncbi:MAG: helix-turn-helix domain-containing protein [Bernardetiaceae bacterium]|nr:helix-turn-helix domain-containing protein [Bernardetiaceae bacterium]